MSAKRISDLPTFFQIFASSSSIARYLLRQQRAKNIVAPPPTKAAEFEVKNRRKSAEKAKTKHLLLLCLFYFKNN